jgi:hypothetical protein
MSKVACKECAKHHPHLGARYVFSCIGCYARWILHKCAANKRQMWEEVKSNKRHDAEQLTNEVRKMLEKK